MKKNKSPEKGRINPRLEQISAKFRKKRPAAKEFAEKILAGDTAWLGRAITLVESTAPEDMALAEKILESVLPHSGNSYRIGITGVPGAGKSTFIDRLGNELIERGHKVAVLAIDPSSALNKGSILGDKTRMSNLASRPEAFIRPSPGGNFSGGVARKTREAIILCEAAGYDRILVETVGVGQSEFYARYITDMLILLKLPGAGDELQGIKRGIMEMADMILINKADSIMQEEARKAERIFRSALQYFTFRPTDRIWVKAISSFSDPDIRLTVDKIEEFLENLRRSGEWENQRREQLEFWFEEHLHDLFRRFLRHNSELRQKTLQEGLAVKNLQKTPFGAAREVWEFFLNKLKSD